MENLGWIGKDVLFYITTYNLHGEWSMDEVYVALAWIGCSK